MNLKTKISRKALSWLISIIMIVSAIGFDPSFSAFADEQQEIDFCIDKMKNLPTDDEFLNQMRKLPTEEDLNQSRHEEIVHADGSKDAVDLDEKEVYEEIKRTVEELTKEFETQESAEEMLNFADKLEEEDDNEKIQTENSNDLPANMQKADAIYRWVAENIHYDFESADCEKTLAERKPQDAYFVFAKQTGICVGYSKLLNLMMRMAGIPCMDVGGLKDSPGGAGHRFSAIYIEDEDGGRKGWTLLDSCWASPNGSDGDAEIKKHLSGEDSFLGKNYMENVLAEKNNYTDELFDEFKIPETYMKLMENPSQEFVDDLNKKIPDILKKLNEKYKDSPHFETFEFFISNWGSLGFKYETNLTMEQAKQAKDKLKEIGKRQSLEGTLNYLTGKSKLNCGVMPSVDSEKNDFSTMMGEELSAELLAIHAKNLKDKVREYGDELQKIYIDVLFSKLDSAKENIEDTNEELNKKLVELNENYSDLTTVKNIKLSIEKGNEGYMILGAFDTGLDEQDLKARFEQYYQAIDYDEEKKFGFTEYFPAFYKKDQSFEEANRSIVTKSVHTISSFSTGDYVKDFYTVNMTRFDWNSYEGAAKIVFDYVDVYDTNYTIGDINKIVEYGFPIRMKIFGKFPDKLVLKNVESIEFDDYTRIKEIDTTGSDRYILEDGVLYEKTDDGGKKLILKFYGEYRTIE